MVNSNNLKHDLMAIRLALFDLKLYMDTHGCDNQAAMLAREYKEKYKKLLEEYECRNGAIEWIRDEECLWAKTPFPWVNSGSDC